MKQNSKLIKDNFCFFQDSGAPLVYKNGNEAYEQIGIISFISSTGCTSGSPAGFTEVYKFKSWINSIIESEII